MTTSLVLYLIGAAIGAVSGGFVAAVVVSEVLAALRSRRAMRRRPLGIVVELDPFRAQRHGGRR